MKTKKFVKKTTYYMKERKLPLKATDKQNGFFFFFFGKHQAVNLLFEMDH